MEKFKIYSGSDIKSRGIILAKLGCNRIVDSKDVKKKIDSIKSSGGVITPTLLAPAKECLKENLEVVLWDDDSVVVDTSYPNLDKVYVIVDGQHRESAIKTINDNPGEPIKFENYYYVPLTASFKVSDLLRDVNTITNPWKDHQFIRHLLQTTPETEHFKHDFLNTVLEHPLAKTKAVVHWLSLDKSKNIYSRQIVSAMVDDSKLKDLSVDTNRLANGKKMYEAAISTLDEVEAGKTAYSDWAVEKYSTLCSQPGYDGVRASDTVATFFKQICESDVAVLKNIKAKRGEVSLSRDSQIQLKLDEIYSVFEKTLIVHPS